MMRTLLTVGVVLALPIRLAAAETPPSFSNQVIPILTKLGCNSGACHGALAGKGGLKLSLRGYDPEADHFTLTRQALGRRVDLQDPARSLVLLKPTLAISHGGGQRLEVGSTDYHKLADWIAEGAPPPRADEPRITQLDVTPTESVLKPQDKLRVTVRATYSDGSKVDVTSWARFNSTEELVAGVDQDGNVVVKGHGETAICVSFSNLVASARVVSPFPNVIEPRRFDQESRRNYIDTLVLKKLQALRIPPSPLCNDHEFIRRVFLDALGILPTPEEVQQFVADSAADKRSRLIETVLNRPEFVDYWSYRWCDLLLISTRKLSQPAVWSFYQFVRHSVADNKPWDQFAREILTARGSTLENGAGNYFVLHKDIAELSEATSVTFLGMSLTCARCHNHPLEKWTQDQYWSLANLFSRVTLKDGDRPGEVVVQSQRFGDVPHLRRGVPMPPTPLDARPLPLDSATDRRAYFADWLTAPDNPYFAKAIINRIWRSYLGRGLVEAEDDLRQTNPPSNAELFDALAQDFVKQRYDVKHLMRLILNSATYQRSSTPSPENAADDRFYSHYLIRRLSAEVILDLYSQVTGVPTPFTQVNVGTTGGTRGSQDYPLGTRALQIPDSQVVSRFLDAFGRPDRTQPCSCERQQDSSVTQALHVNNGQTLNDKLRAKTCRIEEWVKEIVSNDEAIRRIFLLALSRPPTSTELSRFQGVLNAGGDKTTPRRELLEDLFWAVLANREFLFNR